MRRGPKNSFKRNQKKKITNWKFYNKALIHRGSLMFFIENESLEKWYAAKTSKLGRPFKYSDEAIALVLLVRQYFHLPLRQTEGFCRSIFNFTKLNIDVPDYTRLSRRFSTVSRIYKLKRLESPGYIVLDSSGLKVFGESEWLETKYGKRYRRKKWRKIHICVDESGMIVSKEMTDHLCDERRCIDSLIEKAGTDKITCVLGDSGYDGTEVLENFWKKGINPIIRPGRGSPKSDGGETHSIRQKHVNYIEEKGVYAWQNKNKYGRRSKVENTFFRYKEIIGRKLRSRKWSNQEAETHLGCCILNMVTKLGMPAYT